MSVSLQLIAALIAIESGGDELAVGDNGRAIGILQIHIEVLKDVNRTFGTNWQKIDRFDRAKSISICNNYLWHYGQVYERETGKRVTDEIYARIWNGGPHGWQKESTQKYWEKVKAQLEKKGRPDGKETEANKP